MSKTITPKEMVALVAAGGVDVVDVREAREWATGHVPGARLVPLDALRADPAAALPKDNVIFVCAKGTRSATAAKLADARGLKQVYSLDGGTLAWAKAGLPIVVPDEPPAAPATAPTSRGSRKQAAAEAEAATDGAGAVAEPALDAIVGANLKELRTSRGLGLDELARMAGVSRALLGQIELGRSVPSIGIVWKIAQSLGVPFSTLLNTQGGGGTSLLRRSTGKRLMSADGRFSSRALFPFGEPRKVEFYELWLAPHGREEAEPHQPGTRENLVVASGRLELRVAGEKFVLEQGDAIVFAADVAHIYANPDSVECWMHLVMTYTDPVT